MNNNLVSVVFKNTRRADKFKTKKESFLATLAFLIVFCFLAGLMSIFSYLITKQLIKIQQEFAFINLLLLVNFFLLFAKSIFESLNVLYFSKDLKILLRMPIKSKDILHSKLLNLIISEYQMEFIMLAIPMIVYGITTGVNFLFYLYMLVVLIFIPVIPIMTTSLIIALIMRFTNKIKNKNKSMYVTIILATFLVGIITGLAGDTSHITVTNFKTMVLKTNGLANALADGFILIKPIMNTLAYYDRVSGFKYLLILIVENVICYFVTVFLMSKVYLPGAIGAYINGNKRKKITENITFDDLKKKPIWLSYILKELKTLVRTPIFFIECIIIPIVYPLTVFGIVLGLVKFAELVGLDLWVKLNEIALSAKGIALFLSVGQVFYMMNFSSIVAFSREANNAIITKYIPISLIKQFNLKISLGVIVNTFATLLVVMFYHMCTQNTGVVFVLFIELTMVNIIGERLKLIIDLNKPKLKWDGEYTMMKQNTNIMYELFYTFVVVIILLAISLIITDAAWYLFVMIALLFVIDAKINKKIKKDEYKLFGKLF